MTASGGSTRCNCTCVISTPACSVVEQLLQQRLGLVRDLLALVGHRRLDRRPADDVAQRALGRDPDRAFRIVDLEQESARIADLPEYGAVSLDDVLVAGQHLPAAVRLAVGRGPAGPRRAESD